MGSFGLKFSSNNQDVLSQDAKDLKFTTEYGVLKIVKTGDISVTTNGSGDGNNTVAHNLGFAPAYIAFQKRTVQWTVLDASSYANAFVPDPGTANQWGGDYHHALHVYTDGTNIYLQAKGAAASTTYTIHYVLFIDLAEEFTGDDISTIDDFGFKFLKPGIDVDIHEAKQYQLGYSSRYKALQYYDVNYKVATLTLPPAWSSPIDTFVEEGTYVDIAHGLGYAPLFLASFRSQQINPTKSVMLPFVGVNGQDVFSYAVGGFCDATRVRLSFWRSSTYFSGNPSPDYDYEESITVKCYIFTEDLTKTFNL